MNRYFYQVEKNASGATMIHLQGNVYSTDNSYSLAEWTFLYLTLEDVQDSIRIGTFENDVDTLVKYTEEITEGDALSYHMRYYGKEDCKKLSFMDVTQETPCGYYYCDM